MAFGSRWRKSLSKIGSSSRKNASASSGSSTAIESAPISYRKITAIQVRELNELIRKRYALDIKIWSNKNCHTNNRHLVEADMRRSDATLLRIRALVNLWDDPNLWDEPADLPRLQEIKARLNLEGARRWQGNPPWADLAQS